MPDELKTRFVVRAPIAGRMIKVAEFDTEEAADDQLGSIIVALGVPYVDVHEVRSDIATGRQGNRS